MRLTVGVEINGKFTARGAAVAIERNGGVGVNRDLRSISNFVPQNPVDCRVLLFGRVFFLVAKHKLGHKLCDLFVAHVLLKCFHFFTLSMVLHSVSRSQR